MKKPTTLDFSEGPIFRKILMFAIPMMLNSLVQNLYSTADTVMVGQFVGNNAMAAVGASGQPLVLLVNFFAGLGLGVTVVCGNLKGARKQRELNECMQTSVLLGVLVGAVITLMGIPLTRSLLVAIDTPAEILEDAVLYMIIRLAAGIPWLMGAFLANIFYAYGETRLPMTVSIISGFVNVALNALFLIVFDMGVEGVAIATVVSQVINVVAYMVALYNPRGTYKLRLKELKMRTAYVVQILRLGIPTGLNNIVFSVSNVLLQSAVNSFGTVVVAGNTAADNIISYVFLVISNFMAASITATSQCFGARKFHRIDQLTIRSAFGCAAIVAGGALLATIFARPLMELFVNKSEPNWQDVIDKGFPKMMFSCWGYIIFSFAQVFSGVLKGIRKATLALACNLGGVIVPRLIWVWFVVPKMHTPIMLYAIYPISWVISTLILLYALLYCRKKMLAEVTA